jgi:hypothetical protein
MRGSNSQLAFFLVLFVALPAAFAQQPPPSLLPTLLDSSEQIEWTHAEAPDLENIAGAEASLLREYGSSRAERATYGREEDRWQATVHEMVDRSAAYGAFTLLRGQGTPLRLGEAAVQTANRTLFYQGNYFVEARGDTTLAGLQLLARHLKELAGRQASLPTLPGYLPRDGFVFGSDRYLLGPLAVSRVAPLAEGDWVGFAYDAEVEVARYRRGGQQALLLLISYPTPAIARLRMKDFERLFHLNGAGNPSGAEAYARRTGTLIAFVAEADSQPAAEELLERVQYEWQVSWSDPSDPRPRADWAGTLVNIFVGTGVFLLFALLSGIAYGLARVVIKRLAPGRVFERAGSSGEMIVLDLQHDPQGDAGPRGR